MTIKKQLTLLISIITAIPILCVAFILISNHMRSPKRFVSKDENAIREMLIAKRNNPANFSINDLGYIPPEVSGFLVTPKGDVLISSIPEIKAGQQLERNQILNMVFDISGSYYFHFSPTKFNSTKAMLITRIPRRKGPIKSTKYLYVQILSIITIFVAISIIILGRIGRNLFKSVQLLRHQMAEIAKGNLETPIKLSKEESNEIFEISEYLEKMRISLLENQNKKNKFIMGISHDLRTPIAIIRGYAEALSDGIIKSKAEKEKAIKLIKTKISQLENMINTLINFVKLENSDIRKTLVPKSINKLITNFAKEAESTMSVFKRKIIHNIDISKDYLIPLDEQLVNRVFENLLSNALRYTSEDDEIRIIAHDSDDTLMIKFCDTGIGISESDLSNIFDLFYRASNSRREEGMGIGLSVVKNIIETHGWKIDVESEKGKGSCFTIFIPLNQAQAQKN